MVTNIERDSSNTAKNKSQVKQSTKYLVKVKFSKANETSGGFTMR